MKILAFGEILWDVYPDGRFLGGAPLNFAAHLARHGEDVYILSALGNDEPGVEALASLKEWNISTDHITILDGIPTGKCVVTLDEAKVPTYDLWDSVAYDCISCDGIPDEYDVLYFGTLSLRGENNFTEIKRLIDTNIFCEIFVDMNIRPPHYSKETVRFAAENATIIKISDEEMSVVADLLDISGYKDHTDFAKMLSNKYENLQHIIITLGANGAYALQCGQNREFSCPCKSVEVKSTVGAGDSFSAAFLHKYMLGDDIPDCLEYANTLAGFVVSQYDAVPEYDAD